MHKLLLLVFIVAFIDSLIIIVCKSYNNLVKLRNVLESNYADINKELSYRVELVRQFIPIITPYIEAAKISELNTYVAQFNIKVGITELADYYYKFNYAISSVNLSLKDRGFNAPEWTKAFDDSLSRLEALKLIYDDNVLKMNNIVDMPGTSIVAKLFGFVKWPYFRNA